MTRIFFCTDLHGSEICFRKFLSAGKVYEASVVLGFDAYVVSRRDESAPSVDVVEVMHVRSWNEWVEVRDGAEALKPVSARFEELIDPSTVRTIFGTRIDGA